jgi:hypothetical protein
MKNSRLQYPPELSKRLKRPHSLRELKSEIERRLFALFRFYAINPASENAGADLVSRLILDHVPGFQVGGPRGRPRTRETPEAKEARAWLVRKIDEARGRNARLSHVAICKRLVKETDLPKHFRNKDGTPKRSETLRAEIQTARQERIQELVAAFASARQLPSDEDQR